MNIIELLNEIVYKANDVSSQVWENLENVNEPWERALFIIGLVIVALIALKIVFSLLTIILSRFQFRREKKRSISAFNSNNNAYYGSYIKAGTLRKLKKRISSIAGEIDVDQIKSISIDKMGSGCVATIVFKCSKIEREGSNGRKLKLESFKAAGKGRLKGKLRDQLTDLSQSERLISVTYENSRGLGRNNKMTVFYATNDVSSKRRRRK